MDRTAGLMAALTVALAALTVALAALMVDLTEDRMVDRTAARMVDLTLVVAHITAIGSGAGQAGFMATATSGIACGIAGIRSATTVRAGTFAAPTGS
jgi:hypothetical protein